jgi:hypothetical protein
VNPTISILTAGVVTQYILLRKICGNLIERDIKLIHSFRKVHGATSLSRELFHPPLGCKRTQIRSFV